jgi:hypothetical protein
VSVKKQIENELARLSHDKSYALRKIAGVTGRGKQPSFTKTRVKKSTEKLLRLATEAVVKPLTMAAYKDSIVEKKQWHVKKGKGWSWKEKKKKFKSWLIEECGYQNYVYVFWNAKKCIYVGQSTQGKTRPDSHFEKRWFSPVTRIDILRVARKSEVSKLECLTIHHNKPKQNKNRPANSKWTKKCPVCKMHREIKGEMKRIFPFRKTKKKK